MSSDSHVQRPQSVHIFCTVYVQMRGTEDCTGFFKVSSSLFRQMKTIYVIESSSGSSPGYRVCKVPWLLLSNPPDPSPLNLRLSRVMVTSELSSTQSFFFLALSVKHKFLNLRSLIQDFTLDIKINYQISRCANSSGYCWICRNLLVTCTTTKEIDMGVIF